MRCLPYCAKYFSDCALVTGPCLAAGGADLLPSNAHAKMNTTPMMEAMLWLPPGAQNLTTSGSLGKARASAAACEAWVRAIRPVHGVGAATSVRGKQRRGGSVAWAPAARAYAWQV
jgi:hypothetical protein